MELSADGQYGRQEYVKHATRGTYTLHSLYLLLWANFGTLCMALLTQPEAKAAIHGPIISSWQSVKHYCVSQLRTIWTHMQNNLHLLNEERSFLVMCCTKRLYEVCAILPSRTYVYMVMIYKLVCCDQYSTLYTFLPVWCVSCIILSPPPRCSCLETLP